MTSLVFLFALFDDKNRECMGIYNLSSFTLLSFLCFLEIFLGDICNTTAQKTDMV